ncbi:Spatacsin [Varanus komodoensis]|nr:Spatacsin [Varanus komodoensis]
MPGNREMSKLAGKNVPCPQVSRVEKWVREEHDAFVAPAPLPGGRLQPRCLPRLFPEALVATTAFLCLCFALLSSSGADTKKLSALSYILRDSPLSVDRAILTNYTAENFQNECSRILEQLQERSAFSTAREVAELAELPMDNIVIQEVLQNMHFLKQIGHWPQKRTRIEFWKKCNECFEKNGILNRAASGFFSAQADAVSSASPNDEGACCIIERQLLLSLAGHWLARGDPIPLEELEQVEREVWLCRIAQQTLCQRPRQARQRLSHQISVSGERSFESLAKEFSFSKLAALNVPEDLQLERLPAQEAPGAVLPEADRASLEVLIGQLLDEGSVHEASRACRYFNFHSRDVSLVLHCRALASGEAPRSHFHADVRAILEAREEEESERSGEGGAQKRQLPSTSVLGSGPCAGGECPGREVAASLQALGAECVHGRSYCRQVLCLYELSRELGCSFDEISARDPEKLLRTILSSRRADRCRRAQTFIAAQGLGPDTVAELVAGEVTRELLAPAQGQGGRARAPFGSPVCPGRPPARAFLVPHGWPRAAVRGPQPRSGAPLRVPPTRASPTPLLCRLPPALLVTHLSFSNFLGVFQQERNQRKRFRGSARGHGVQRGGARTARGEGFPEVGLGRREALPGILLANGACAVTGVSPGMHWRQPALNPAEGSQALLQLARLCPDPALVGKQLLERIAAVPPGELACTTELLILAHSCFSLTCHMEGIIRVLQAARMLTEEHLAPSEEYGLVVRLLTGIGRYNEMTYIFDLLHEKHHFEVLMRKKLDSVPTLRREVVPGPESPQSCVAERELEPGSPEPPPSTAAFPAAWPEACAFPPSLPPSQQSGALKTALLDYAKRRRPGDSEKHNMIALCFSMCREIGENHEAAARTQLKLIDSCPWEDCLQNVPHLKTLLMKALTLFIDAAESYSKDFCVHQSLHCNRLTKLITLQLHFLNTNRATQLINLSRKNLLGCVMALPRFYQAAIVAEAYDFVPDWAEVLYQRVIVKGDFNYLEEYKQCGLLKASTFEEIAQKFKQRAGNESALKHLKKLLTYCDDIYVYYKLAYDNHFYDVVSTLLQDAQTGCCLNDLLTT